MLISLIIPVYNVEFFLEKCLNSIFSQEIDELLYEVIIVNDGSTDKSLSICEKFQSEYSNVILINQENKGLSGARNSGMSVASGEYVWFIDSDDWITDKSIQSIISVVESKNPDVIALGSGDYINNENILRYDLNICRENNYSTIEYLKWSNFEVGIVIYVIKRDFLISHNFSFYEGIYHEDNEFTYRLIYEINSIEYISDIIYVVNLREGSITRSINSKRSYDLLIVCNVLNDYVQKKVLAKDKIIFINLISMLFNSALFNIKDFDYSVRKQFEKEINKYNFIIKNLIKSDNFKYKLEGLLMFIFKKRRITIYRAMKFFA